MALTAHARKGVYALVALIGYVLSPLSWWNDALVNIPLSLAAGYAIHKITGINLDLAVAGAYTASNILGIALLAWGAGGAMGLKGRRLLVAVLASIVYSAVILLILP